MNALGVRVPVRNTRVAKESTGEASEPA